MPETRQRQQIEAHLERLSLALAEGQTQSIQETINALSTSEIGQILEALPKRKRLQVWQLIDKPDDGEVLVHVNDEVRLTLIRATADKDLVASTGKLDVDDLADIIDDLPDVVTNEVLRSMDDENRSQFSKVMAYPEDTAGGLMDLDIVTVRADVSLDVVLRYLRLRGTLPDFIDHLFVVDRIGRYLGKLALTDLLTRNPDSQVSSHIDVSIPAINVATIDTEVAHIFEHHNIVSAPVVDADDILVGRITIDDAIDLIREEADHNVLSMAGLDEEGDMFAPVVKSTIQRAIWLGVNMLTAFFAVWAIKFFEATLDQVVTLAILYPVVMSMGGIAGTQTLTLMIRGMAVGQVGSGNLLALFNKEFAVGALNGLLWSTAVAVIVILWIGDIQIGIVIAAATAINLLAAALCGVAIPIVLRRFNIDPALAGGVILTTVTDVVGALSFLGLGTLFLLNSPVN